MADNTVLYNPIQQVTSRSSEMGSPLRALLFLTLTSLLSVTILCLLQQKKRQKTLVKIKQLAEDEDSKGGAVQQKGKGKGGSRSRNQTKGGKAAPAKKNTQKGSKQSAAISNCNILPYFTMKK